MTKMTRQLSDILTKYRQSCLHCPEKLSWPPQRDRYLAVWTSTQDMTDFYEHTAFDSDLGRRKYNRLLSAVHTIPSHTRDPVVTDHAIICSTPPWCWWPIEVVKSSGPSVMVIDLIALSPYDFHWPARVHCVPAFRDYEETERALRDWRGDPPTPHSLPPPRSPLLSPYFCWQHLSAKRQTELTTRTNTFSPPELKKSRKFPRSQS